jgi:hypothetical protein
MCQEGFTCFNSIFGDGTDRKGFGDRVNLGVCLEAFGELSAQVKQKPIDRVNGIVLQYQPNREARRSKK